MDSGVFHLPSRHIHIATGPPTQSWIQKISQWHRDFTVNGLIHKTFLCLIDFCLQGHPSHWQSRHSVLRTVSHLSSLIVEVQGFAYKLPWDCCTTCVLSVMTRGRTGLPVCQGAKSWVASRRQNVSEQLDSFPVTVFLVFVITIWGENLALYLVGWGGVNLPLITTMALAT